MSVPGSFRKYGPAAGDKGLARIELARIGSKTAISRLRTMAPLLVQKALYPDSRLPGMAHVYLMSSAGGILHGDRMEIDIVAGSGTESRVTTQAATKIYKMDRGYAAQSVAISARDSSYLEFLPYQIIPFKSSRFYQQVDVQLEQNATVVYSETVSAGRTASGENFDFDICFLKMAARDSKGKVLFADAARLEPGKDELVRLFGGKSIWSMIYVITPDFESVNRQVGAAIKDRSMLAGSSVLPHDCGLVIRMLDDSIDKIRHLTEAVAGIARSHALAVAAEARAN
ncbi:MAG TPA: urease accessory protein UreD [Nitrososphaera sp.]|nr:urease accessory protein UreD [Nitrososphaera sp.]